jgi:AcrR family transcriptional regulator
MQTSTPRRPTPSARRRHQQRQGARRAILDATEALLVEHGLESFSMRRLAHRCGYTAPTIYHHFGDKQGLIDAVAAARIEIVLARVRRVRRREDPVDTLRVMLLEFARLGLENPTHYRILALPRPPGSDPLPEAEQIRALVEEPLGALAAVGRLRDGGVEEAVQFVWALLHGLVSLCISRPDYAWSNRILELSIDAALRGLVRPVRGGGAGGLARSTR